MEKKIEHIIKELRLRHGWTQSRLSQASGVSLPTIQNLEAERANPSLKTLSAIIAALGASLELRLVPPDWNGLIACGLPLQGVEVSRPRPSAERLRSELRRALLSPLSGRERDAVAALVWALKEHYPTFYRDEIQSPIADRLLAETSQQRLIKLRRVALSRLGRFL